MKICQNCCQIFYGGVYTCSICGLELNDIMDDIEDIYKNTNHSIVNRKPLFSKILYIKLKKKIRYSPILYKNILCSVKKH